MPRRLAIFEEAKAKMRINFTGYEYTATTGEYPAQLSGAHVYMSSGLTAEVQYQRYFKSNGNQSVLPIVQF